jgi:hypothetical protein
MSKKLHYSVTGHGMRVIHLVGFKETSSFVDADGTHKPRTLLNKSRRSDMRDIADMAARANPTLTVTNGFVYSDNGTILIHNARHSVLLTSYAEQDVGQPR